MTINLLALLKILRLLINDHKEGCPDLGCKLCLFDLDSILKEEKRES